MTGEGSGTPLQYSCLENPMDGGAWKAAVHEVAEGRTWLSDFTFTFHFHALEKDGNPLQCSCLENPRDGGAWWASVCGVTQSRTRLQWLSSSSSRFFNGGVNVLLTEGVHGSPWFHPVNVSLVKGFSSCIISGTKLPKEDCWLTNDSPHKIWELIPQCIINNQKWCSIEISLIFNLTFLHQLCGKLK